MQSPQRNAMKNKKHYEMVKSSQKRETRGRKKEGGGAEFERGKETQGVLSGRNLNELFRSEDQAEKELVAKGMEGGQRADTQKCSWRTKKKEA